MGNNAHGDAKRATLGLSGMYYKRWQKHILAKTMEDGIINAYLNYLLDPGCPIETWPVFHHNLVQELIDSGGDMKRRGMYRVRRVFFFLVNRVEHQKRTQTATKWWPFGFVFGVQLGLRHTQALINI